MRGRPTTAEGIDTSIAIPSGRLAVGDANHTDRHAGPGHWRLHIEVEANVMPERVAVWLAPDSASLWVESAAPAAKSRRYWTRCAGIDRRFHSLNVESSVPAHASAEDGTGMERRLVPSAHRA
jgi:hypothetical protein